MSKNFFYRFVRPALFSFNPEFTHHFTLRALDYVTKFGFKKINQIDRTVNGSNIMGLFFENRVGLAAGLDKDGAYIDALASLGFGSIEIGTTTLLPQPGNVKPRIFRLTKSEALINRMGFNNQGIDKLIINVQKSKYFQNKLGILGINIGKNANTSIENATQDYLSCMNKAYQYADYITINISSPNTNNLRQLQEPVELTQLLSQIKDRQLRLADEYKRYVPVVLKIAPDVNSEQIKIIAGLLTRFNIDGVIATNTTVSRDSVRRLPHGHENGGLSGKPLFNLSNTILFNLKQELGNALPIIGVGGICSARDARQKVDLGADLVQLYTGLIYQGPKLIYDCVKELHKI